MSLSSKILWYCAYFALVMLLNIVLLSYFGIPLWAGVIIALVAGWFASDVIRYIGKNINLLGKDNK